MDINITPEVKSTSQTYYLVRINGEEMCLVETEDKAKLAVDSIAAHEVKRLEEENVKIYREDLDNGKKVVISSQILGMIYNGSIIQVEDIDFVPVGFVNVIKGRHELSKIPPPPPPMPKDIFRRIKERRQQIESDDNSDEDEEIDIPSEIEEDDSDNESYSSDEE